jgi:hypothetical protein
MLWRGGELNTTLILDHTTDHSPERRLVRDLAFQREMAFEFELMLHRNLRSRALISAMRMRLRFEDIWCSLIALDPGANATSPYDILAYDDMYALGGIIRSYLLRASLATSETRWRECARAIVAAEGATNTAISALESSLRKNVTRVTVKN